MISFLDWIFKLSMGEDLAERVDDLICAWDQVVGTELDTVVMLLLGEEKKTPFKQNGHLLNIYCHTRPYLELSA